MNKIKIALVLALTFTLSSCQNDDYVSKRHPEGEKAEISDSALDDNSAKDGENKETSENTNESSKKDANQTQENSVDKELKEDGLMYTVDDVVNMRLAPSPDSSVITTVSPGDELLKLGDSDDRSRVTVNGQTGYIRSDLLIKE